MSLTVVATPIGNLEDISVGALKCLKEADVIVGEERAEASKLLKFLGIEQKEIYLLNEHSRKEDLDELLEICRTKKVALVSDCGTPGFCDPGHQLVHLCRNHKIPISTRPGASSLMSILSLSSQRINNFVFIGFLPADKDERKTQLNKLKSERRTMVLMETPYRLQKWIEELQLVFSDRKVLLALNLTQENERVFEGTLKNLATQINFDKKSEPILIIYEENQPPLKPNKRK